MKRFILLMHDDTVEPERADDWGPYLQRLRDLGCLDGGSSLAAGVGHRRTGTPGSPADHLVGYLLVSAPGADGAAALLEGNPVYDAGGTVEIRELVED